MVITLCNPPLNVLDTQVRIQLKAHLQQACDDGGITTIIITGEGKALMAGADISGFPSMVGNPYSAYDFAYSVYDVWYFLEQIDKPTIVAINGLALGAGLEMSLCCDIRIAAENAKLGFPELKLGLFPGGGGTQRLARLIGASKTKELIYLSEPISAQEALNLGIVNQVVPKGEALPQALAMAERINQFSLVALGAAKRAVNRGSNAFLREGIEWEAKEFRHVFGSEDVGEGVQAFLEKRPPVFKNK